ncbi:unnamed protein product [Zymoseptoria tritici ST99CH_1A5]|nr:unnamed protein product [Zymoseptoria tritici ST99CH_1A5]
MSSGTFGRGPPPTGSSPHLPPLQPPQAPMRARYQVTTRLPTVRSPAMDMCTEYVGQTKKIPKSVRDDDEARRGGASVEEELWRHA